MVFFVDFGERGELGSSFLDEALGVINLILFVKLLLSTFSFEEEHTNVSPVHEDVVVRLVCLVAAETSADDAMPSRIIHRIKLSLDDLRNIIKHSLLSKRIRNAVHCVLLHAFRHVHVLYDCVPRLPRVQLPDLLGFLMVFCHLDYIVHSLNSCHYLNYNYWLSMFKVD